MLGRLSLLLLLLLVVSNTELVLRNNLAVGEPDGLEVLRVLSLLLLELLRPSVGRSERVETGCELIESVEEGLEERAWKKSGKRGEGN